MTTAERIEAIAAAAKDFPILGPVRREDLVALLRAELGHEESLEGFRPHGSHFTKAVAPSTILHVVSGNTPHAGLQTLVRGLLLGSRNLVKVPSAGFPEVGAFRDALPPSLQDTIEISPTLPPSWLDQADAVVVFGDDETIAHFRARVRPGIPFQAHGHRVSLGIVFDDPDASSAPAAARDVSLYDQQGCLSPHDIYVDESCGLSARTYAARLAEAMEEFNRATPRRELTVGGNAAIADLRASYAFRAGSDTRVQIWCSEDSTDWTVIYEEDSWFATSPLNRVVFVKPLPADLPTALAPILPWLAAVGIFPATEAYANRVVSLGGSIILPLGRMQFPPLTWHAEGLPNLGSLVRWVDFLPNP